MGTRRTVLPKKEGKSGGGGDGDGDEDGKAEGETSTDLATAAGGLSLEEQPKAE